MKNAGNTLMCKHAVSLRSPGVTMLRKQRGVIPRMAIDSFWITLCMPAQALRRRDRLAYQAVYGRKLPPSWRSCKCRSANGRSTWSSRNRLTAKVVELARLPRAASWRWSGSECLLCWTLPIGNARECSAVFSQDSLHKSLCEILWKKKKRNKQTNK